MKTKLFLILFMSGLVSIQAKTFYDIRSIVYDACPVQSAAINYDRVNLYYNRVKRDKAKLRKSLEASIYTACYLKFSKHKVGMSFLLGHVGLVKSLEPATIPYMTSFMNKNVLGKRQYIDMGDLWQNIKQTGLDPGFITEVIAQSKRKRYRGVYGIAP